MYNYIFNKLVKYKRKTTKVSYSYVINSKNKLVAKIFTPKDLSMNYEEFSVINAGITLKGWYIGDKDAKKTIVFVHGRESNKITTLRFVRLFNDMNLDKKYNIVLVDLRNSGDSTKSKTGFGYYFALDVKNVITYIKNKYNQKDFILYGFSQGAMASMITTKLYKDYYTSIGVNISKMILDSPLANAKETIIRNLKIFNIHIPRIIYYGALKKFNKYVDDYFDNMKMSYLLGEVPTLIIQSETDKVTTYDIFKSEYEKLLERMKENSNLAKTELKIFKNGLHVRSYLIYRWEYTNTIKQFLEKEEEE